jgi:hypothetical protein
MSRVAPTGVAVLLAVACGCGQSTSTFTGKVTYQGQPVTSGVIYFLGPAPKMQMGMGTIRDDGTYVATDVPVGEVRVSFQVPKLPAKYADPNTSGLVYAITSGMASLDIAVP